MIGMNFEKENYSLCLRNVSNITSLSAHQDEIQDGKTVQHHYQKSDRYLVQWHSSKDAVARGYENQEDSSQLLG